ncbi:MAG: T9SS type A sorting domain-containing protein [candidate division Zixibacteria bacterium]|nr:T9SS type A sorting domain-containing protein [Candidatus Tariuqbacter arcticus]
MLPRILKAVLLLSLAFSLTFAGVNAPTALKVSKPTLIGAPQGWAPTDEDSSVYYMDFENGWEGWTTVDVTAAGIQWHIDDFNAYQGNSWWCGDSLLAGYDNHWLQYLVSPTLDFSDVTSPVLTFQLFYAVEDPGGEPPPYDGWDGCNVWASIDGGEHWMVIQPTTPAYNCQNLYSFGVEWGMGPGIPGWGGSSGGWVNAQFNLSAAAGYSDVMVRFAFCSDPAYCTVNNPSLIGMFVDNVSIDDGAVNLLSNDADNPPYPEEFTFDTGDASGDWWEINDNTAHSPTHSANCVIEDHYDLSNALVTPWLSIPEDFNVYYTFWLWCDMLDFTGGGGTTLEDYYVVEGTTDGVIWLKDEFGFHDYGDIGRPGAALVGWEEYLPGDPYNGNMMLDLTAYAGQDIKLRWRVITDGDNNGGIGTGLHIDDFNLWVSTMLNNDVGAASLEIPFPTSLSNAEVTGTVTLENFGSQNQSAVPAFARMDSSATNIYPLIPWANIPSGETVEKEFNWDLTTAGDFYWDAYTSLMLDENRENDTTSAGYVTVTPEHIYELGYDARGMGWPNHSLYYWSFDPGNGAMCRFVPVDHNLPEPIDITEAKFYFYSPGTFTFHLYDAGTTAQPGPEITSFDVTVTILEISPEWKTVDLSGITALQNRTQPFWFWVESQDPDAAQIMGDSQHFGEGHFFTYNGSSASATSMYEFFIRCMAGAATAPELTVTLTPENPPIVIPANGGSFNFNIAATNSGTSPVTFDVWTYATLPTGNQYGPIIFVTDFTIPAGATIERDRTQEVPAGAPPGSYTYDAYVGVYPDIVWDEDHFDFTKSADSDGGPLVPDWYNWGESFDDLTGEASAFTPQRYEISPAYPNPFNPETHLSFALPNNGKVSLIVYDITGREVAILAEGWYSAGSYEVVFDGSALASGVYFASFKAGDFIQVRKMVLMK